MNQNISNWIDNVLCTDAPDTVVAYCFNLYEERDGKWSMELVGTDGFDPENEDWACGEVTDFSSRETPYQWEMDCEWEEVLNYMANELRQYLAEGKYAELLKAGAGVGVGFVDGNIEILYNK